MMCAPLCTVFTSTVNVVYHGQTIRDGREDDFDYPLLSKHTDHYSRTKQMAEELVLTSSGKRNSAGTAFNACSLRLNAIYGPNEQRHLPRIIDVMKSGVLKAVFRPDTKQDFSHIDNCVQAHVKVW